MLQADRFRTKTSFIEVSEYVVRLTVRTILAEEGVVERVTESQDDALPS